MAIANKAEIRAYFETHNESPKAVASHFGISYRTLAHWIKSESWERARALQGVRAEVVRDELLQKNLGGVLQTGACKIKRQIRANLGTLAGELDEMILNNLLDSSTDEILLQAMSSKFIQSNIALSTIIAKNELMALMQVKGGAGDPMVIACAEKVAKMFADMQVLLYGKEPAITKLEARQNSLESMSEQELLALIAQGGS